MALRCQCGYELWIQPHGSSDIETIRMNQDQQDRFDSNKDEHEKTCEQFKEWEIYFCYA